ncbi:MAG: hypothetical protein NVS1B4_22150 [Gemmatimonadaceae bacterium]
MNRRLLTALALIAFAPPVAAQIGPRPVLRHDPLAWATVGLGLPRLGGVADGPTNSYWDFGQTLTYSGALEAEIGNGLAVGVAGSYGNFPLRYFSGDFNTLNFAPPPGSPCPGGCNAHARVSTIVANVHVGSGVGFHQVIEGGLGAQRYEGFTDDRSGARLPPTGTTDLFFRIGYGFGIGLTPNAQITLVQDYGQALHRGANLPNNIRTTNESYLTRVSVRLGLGSRAH